MTENPNLQGKIQPVRDNRDNCNSFWITDKSSLRYTYPDQRYYLLPSPAKPRIKKTLRKF